MQANQNTGSQQKFNNSLKAIKKSKEYIDLLEVIAGSTHHEAALIKKSGELLTNLYKTLDQRELALLGGVVQENIGKDSALQAAYHLSCLAAIDSCHYPEGTVSLKLLPVYLKTRNALSQLYLRPGLGQLRLLADLTQNLKSPYSQKSGWVEVLPQLIHQSSFVEIDLSLLVLIKHIAVKIKQKTSAAPPMTFPLQCREIGVSDKNSNLYFIPVIHFEPTPCTDTALTLPNPDWDKTARFVDKWLVECGYPPGDSDSYSPFQHGQSPVFASEIFKTGC